MSYTMPLPMDLNRVDGSYLSITKESISEPEWHTIWSRVEQIKHIWLGENGSDVNGFEMH